MNADRLAARLRMAGVGQADLARFAEQSEALISRALRGERKLTPRVVTAAEQLLRRRALDAVAAAVGGEAGGGGNHD